MQIRRLYLAESCGDYEQSVPKGMHTAEPIGENRPLNGERVNQVGQVLPLYDASVFQASDRVVAERECCLLNFGEPACKTRKIKRAFLASVDKNHAAWCVELSATALREDRNRRR